MESQNEKAKISRLLGRLAAEALNKQKPYEALEHGIAAYIATRDTDLKTDSIAFIRVACLHIWQADRIYLNKQYCSFCGKAATAVKKLVAGPNVFICNECVDLCHNTVHEKKE
jgi:hypothetical protein